MVKHIFVAPYLKNVLCFTLLYENKYNDHRCLQVVVFRKTLKWWSLQTGGRYSEVVVSSGLSMRKMKHILKNFIYLF